MNSAPAMHARERLDAWLCLGLAVLIGWGLVMVASASVDVAQKTAGSPMYYFDHQLLYGVFGLVCAGFVFAVPMELWRKHGFWLLAAAVLVLAVVLIPGIGLRVNESRRWLGLGLFRVQVSEPARLIMLIYLAGYIVRRQAQLQHSLLGLLPVFLPLCLVAGLMLAEPDFGGAAIFMGVAVLMLFVGGARLRDILGLGVLLAVLMGLIAVAAPYRVARLMSFVDPWSHALNSGFQLVQSLIAVGRGEWFGVGLGASVEKLHYLPEMHTDFIFAILAEELGLAGVTALIATYGVVVWRGFVIGRCAAKRQAHFEACLCYGLTSWLGIQALVNMAVNMGLLPTKGLTLPFISYGGSSLVTALMLAALLLRVDYETRVATFGRSMGRSTGHPIDEGRVFNASGGGRRATPPGKRGGAWPLPGLVPVSADLAVPLRNLGGRLLARVRGRA